MQADPGNTGAVLDQVTQKYREAINQMSQQKTVAATPQVTAPQLKTEAPKVPADVTSSWGKLSEAMGGVGARLFMINQAAQVAMMAVRGIAGAIEPFIRLNSEVENIQTRFKVLIGDAEKAKQAFAETKKYADTTPFKLNETAAARARLFSAGIEDLDTLKAAGDLAAASGRSIEEAAMAFARLKSGASGEAMEMLRLMNISRAMFRAQGIEFDAGGQALASAEKTTEALRNIIKDNFGGMTEELGKQWSGLWSTFQDTVDNVMRSVSGSSFVTLKSVIADVIQSLNALLKSEKIQQFGGVLGSLLGSIVDMAKLIGTVFAPLGEIISENFTKVLAVAAGVIATIVAAILTAANAVQAIVDLTSGKGPTKSWEDAKARQNTIVSDYAVRMQQASAAVTGETFSLEKNTEATNKNARERERARSQAISSRDTTVAELRRIMVEQESVWAVEKARGRDSVLLAQSEMEQAKYNVEIMREKEAAVKAAMEASGKQYIKSSDMLSAESKYAQSIEKYYDALIAKQETIGQFITKTSKLLAEADATDKRGGDSGVKRYEALKTAVDEYLDSLKKMREAQAQTATNSARMQAAAEAARTGNLAQYQNAASVIDQAEKVFNIGALQERLAQIQQLSQAQNLGARERFSLYEQERSVFAELTGSIGSAIEDTMQKIEAMQSKALGAASSAIGILEKVGAKRSDYQAVADMISSLRLDPANMSLQNLGQLANIADQLKKKKIRVSDIMPSPGEVLNALRKELSGASETIGKLENGLQTLVGLAASVGGQAAENFWKPWEKKLAGLKEQIASLGNANLNPLGYAPPPVPIPEAKPASQETKPVQINQQTSLNIQGSTLRDVEAVVQQAKERFGEELYAALQEANSQYGFS